MKLLQKTNRSYLLLSATAFIVACLVIYYILSLIFDAQLNEKISDNKMKIVRNLEKNGIIEDNPPFVEVKEIESINEQQDLFSDTLIFDQDENEMVVYRELTCNERVRDRYYRIIIRNTLIEKSDILLTIIAVLGSVFALLLISLYLLNRRLSLKMWQPFYNTLNEMKKFSQKNSSFELPPSGKIDEFIELNSTLDNMGKRIISDYQSLKMFTEDASHEIQTPLTVIRSKLESVLQFPELKKEQVESIHAALSATTRLSKLTKAMLMISKIENNQFEGSEEINLSDLIEKQFEILNDIISEKKLLTKKISNSVCLIRANHFQVESLVRNLVENAVKHSTNGGSLIIELNNNSLIISNTGEPLTVPVEKLFNRFFKGNPASDSPGLGLSIVKKICEVNSWKITYVNDKNLHMVKLIF
jgi:two-component system, OmpR family, sensor kinase